MKTLQAFIAAIITLAALAFSHATSQGDHENQTDAGPDDTIQITAQR